MRHPTSFQKELLWEQEKYQKQKYISVNLELTKWSTKYFLIKKYIQPRKTDQVLDIGSGYGTILFLISNQIDTGIGVDISRTAVNVANKIKSRLRKNNLIFKVGNANKLRFSTNSFDKIICFDVAEHLVKPERLFSLFFPFPGEQ